MQCNNLFSIWYEIINDKVGRCADWQSKLSAFCHLWMHYWYIEGKSNLVANVNSCLPVETPSEDVNNISTALSTSSLDHHQWPITSAVFFISPTINWSSFNQLVDASLNSSFRGYSFVNFRIGFVICSSSRTDFICLVSLYGRTNPLEQMPGPI